MVPSLDGDDGLCHEFFDNTICMVVIEDNRYSCCTSEGTYLFDIAELVLLYVGDCR